MANVEKQLLQQESLKNFPIKISDDTIISEDDIATYASTLTNGERQLLIADKLKSMYVTDGKGSYIKINSNDVSQEQLDKIKETFYNKEEIDDKLKNINVDKANVANKIKGIESAPLFSVYGKSPNGEMGFYEFPIGVINDETNKFQSVRQNAKANEVYTIELISPNKLNDLIIQAYEFIQGEQDVVTTLKEFNNKDANNFYYDKDNLVFTNEGAKIKNIYNVMSTNNQDTGFYELDLSQEGFISDIADISIEEVK